MRTGLDTIAGKTHAEILAMKRHSRCYWYKTISPEEKQEAMMIVDRARSADSIGRPLIKRLNEDGQKTDIVSSFKKRTRK